MGHAIEKEKKRNGSARYASGPSKIDEYELLGMIISRPPSAPGLAVFEFLLVSLVSTRRAIYTSPAVETGDPVRASQADTSSR